MAKLNAAGTALVYSTYLGGDILDGGKGIAVDAAGNAYVTGGTSSSNFPTASPLQATKAGGSDAFVTKFNAAGSALVYSTYLGGNGFGSGGNGIAVDAAGSAYVTGFTYSSDFPTVSPLQATNGGSEDAFVAKLSSTLPFGAFAVFEPMAKIDLDRRVTKNAFSMRATFTLGPTSNGIAPLTEAVTVQVGTFTTTIPAGSFTLHKGRFTFAGVINGAKLKAELRPLILGNDYEFKVFGVHTDLTGTVNPLTVGLTIGDDSGSKAVTATYYK